MKNKFFITVWLSKKIKIILFDNEIIRYYRSFFDNDYSFLNGVQCIGNIFQMASSTNVNVVSNSGVFVHNGVVDEASFTYSHQLFVVFDVFVHFINGLIEIATHYIRILDNGSFTYARSNSNYGTTNFFGIDDATL